MASAIAAYSLYTPCLRNKICEWVGLVVSVSVFFFSFALSLGVHVTLLLIRNVFLSLDVHVTPSFEKLDRVASSFSKMCLVCHLVVLPGYYI